jgi:hypothetical protein
MGRIGPELGRSGRGGFDGAEMGRVESELGHSGRGGFDGAEMGRIESELCRSGPRRALAVLGDAEQISRNRGEVRESSY